ncbi:heparanase-like protein 3 [Tanacetum coccineum]
MLDLNLTFADQDHHMTTIPHEAEDSNTTNSSLVNAEEDDDSLSAAGDRDGDGIHCFNFDILKVGDNGVLLEKPSQTRTELVTRALFPVSQEVQHVNCCFECVYVDSKAENGSVLINGESGIAEIDSNFICATMDWWPPEKCDYGTCSWDHASLLNVHLISRAEIVFGLNALNGREVLSDGSTNGAWDSTNAESFMRYTVKKNYTMYAWELGNELSGSGVGARVTASQYVIDTTTLKNIVEEIYDGIDPKPRIISPGGFFDANWFEEFINGTNEILDVVTHHIYNLGAGVDKDLVEKILDPSYLDGEADTFKQLEDILEASGTSASAWVGEAGGAYNSGHDLVTNAFVFSFWYLDQLGMSAVYDTKTYCRQTLIGGNYGLLNTTTFVPNPDYYSALLWHRLMGNTVLSTNFIGTKKMRSYAHCAKESDGLTLLLINLDNTTTINVNLSLNTLLKFPAQIRMVTQDTKMDDAETREEYHLTAKDGNLHSQTMILNGKELNVSSEGYIPPLEPLNVSSSEPIVVAPYSIVYAHIPYLTLDACADLVMDL